MLEASNRAAARAGSIVTSFALACLTVGLIACGGTDTTSTPEQPTQPMQPSTPTTDATAPTIGAAISFGNTAATTVTVSWGAATDNATGASDLAYKVVRATDAAQIDTVEEVVAFSSAPGLVLDFTRGVTSTSVSGLAAGTRYTFAVVVRDAAGNASLYTPASVTTLDASAPTVGAPIAFTDVGDSAATVTWGAASDDVTPPNELQYKVVRADTAAEIDTLAEIAAITEAPALVQDFKAAITSLAVTDLSASHSYAFAVVVQDAKHNQALYAPATFATRDGTPPEVGTPISFIDITPSAVTVSWGLADDGVTAAEALVYKLVRASDLAAIDTLEEADAIVAGDDGLIADYAPATAPVTVSGLDSSTTYAFAVIVRDEAGNQALYDPAAMMTLDATAPMVTGPITVGNVGATSLELSWTAATDDVTPASGLSYKVVRASSASAIDSLAEVALITAAPGLVQDYTAELTTQAVTGLLSSSSYAFAVVVRDGQGNEALYSPVTQVTTDDSAPVPGAALSFGSVTTTSLTVSWGRATDNITAQSALRYKLVVAPTLAEIDTVDEADAITGAGLLLNDVMDATSNAVMGLASSRTYAFAVIVRDAAGNRALYAPATVATLDASSPTTGTAISFANVTATSVGLAWGAASDDVTPAASLTYKVVRGPDAASIDTLAEVDAIVGPPGLIADYAANLTTVTAGALTGSTSYAFAVVVRDAAGNRALYTPAVRSTLDGTAPAPGNAVYFASAAATAVTVAWGAGTDNVTAPPNLQYKLVKAASASDIDTLPEAAAITGADVVRSFATSTSPVRVTGLTSSTRYAFAVIVRDDAGNQALYAPAEISTLDISAPVPGAATTFSAATATGMTVSWGAGTDDVSAAPDLRYKLVRASTAAAIDTLQEVAAITSGPGLVLDFTANTYSAMVTGLTSSTNYAFTVAVRDEAGNIAIYSPQIGATLDITPPVHGSGIVTSSPSATGMTVSWGAGSDDVTVVANLQYKVVRADTVAEIDTLPEIDAITSGPALVQGFTSNLTTLPVSGLSSSHTYAFAVVVRDLAGNRDFYAPVTGSTLDVTSPATGTPISFASVGSSTLTVNWGAGTDDVTVATSLQYKVVRAAVSADIDTKAEADAITGGGLVQDWTTNLTSQAVTGLSPSTPYAFAVLVRDAANNKELYAPAPVTTGSNPPSPGAGISFSAVSGTGLTISWGASTDDTTAQPSLEYRLVRGTLSTAVDTPAEVAAVSGADLLVDWTAATGTHGVTGLSAGDFHFYAVAVRDQEQNMALYAPRGRVTGPIFYVTTNAHSANLGDIAGADGLCASERHASAATDVTPRAVLGGATRRACSTPNCNSAAENMDWPLQAGRTYYNTDGEAVGVTNGAGIFSFPLMHPMISSGGTVFGFSGLQADWTNYTMYTCSSWTDNLSAGNSAAGEFTAVSNQAIYRGVYVCNVDASRVLCVEP